MQRKTALMVASAAMTALAASAVHAQTLAVSIGVRETNSAVPIGDNGGTTNGIEWVNRDGQTLQLNDTWQTFTWNFGTDPVLAFAGATANGTLDFGRGVLEHIRFLNGVGAADEFEVFIDTIVNTVAGTPTTVSGFENTENPPADLTDINGGFMFHTPRFSGSTNTNLITSPDIAQVSDVMADTGTQSLRTSWAFVDAGPTRWVRFTTFNTAEKANPTIDYNAGNSLSMRMRGRVLQPSIRWNATGGGNWSDTANWNNGTVAGVNFLNTDVAYFGNSITAPTTVVADVPLTLNTLRIKSPFSYTFNTTDPNVNTLTLTGPAGFTGNINAEQGSHNINIPILLTDRGLTVSVGEAGATLNIASINFDGNGIGFGQSMVKSGAGTVVLPHVRSFIDNPDDTPPEPFPNPSRFLSIEAGSVRLAQSTGAPVVSRMNRLIMSGVAGAWTGQFDINNNALILDYADLSLGGLNPLGLQEDRLRQGYAGGSWNGNGIASSAAAATPGHSVGIADIVDLGSPGTFMGEPVDGTAVVLRYTRTGDADLTGTTDIGDFALLAANFNAPDTRWARGDFNYDGTTDIGDFALLAANFNQSVADLPRGSVPEPAGLGLLGLAAVALTGRRRR